MARLKVSGYIDLDDEQLQRIEETDDTGAGMDEMTVDVFVDDLEDLHLVVVEK